jgi:hypothetical protein
LCGCGFVASMRRSTSSVLRSGSDMISQDILLGPRLKAERADSHINELIRLTQPLSGELFSIAVEPSLDIPDHEKPMFDVAYRPKKPIPQTLGLVIGDAIHNLRAALDHLATGIIRTKDPEAKPYFPVSKKRDDLVNSGSLAAMEAALPGTKKLLLDKIRPVDDARNALWAFSSLDIDDKHNLILPVVTIAEIRGFSIVYGSTVISNATAINDAAYPFMLATTRTPLTIQGNPQPIVQVEFGKGTPFKGHPVIPTLLDIRNLVGETLNAFSELIGS